MESGEQMPQIQNKVKIDLIVIGNPNSGKTSLIRRFIQGETAFSHFYNPTLGLSLQKKVIKIGSSEATVCIWDTAGQQKFFSLTKNYFKKADGVLVVFDLTDKNSFERIQRFWMPQIKEKSDENCSQILIGNKKDVPSERKIDLQLAAQLSQKLNIPYFETSAKTGEGVNQAIQFLVKECLQKVRQDEKRGVDLTSNGGMKKSSRCFAASKQFFESIVNKFK